MRLSRDLRKERGDAPGALSRDKRAAMDWLGLLVASVAVRDKVTNGGKKRVLCFQFSTRPRSAARRREEFSSGSTTSNLGNSCAVVFEKIKTKETNKNKRKEADGSMHPG